jgi:tRNA(fMet)-specific endonuclease VapC
MQDLKEEPEKKTIGGSSIHFLKKSSVITIDASVETADFFGVIKNSLKQAGRPIPINDVWIAAHALEHGVVLVTRDKHFHWVAGLRLWDHI